MTIGIFGFFNVQKTMLLQIITSLVRWTGNDEKLMNIFMDDFTIIVIFFSLHRYDHASLYSFSHHTTGGAGSPTTYPSGRTPQSLRCLCLLLHVSSRK